MAYDGMLVFGVAFAVGYALLASMQWSYPLRPMARIVLQAALFGGIGIYFVVCWTHTGQSR